jgi:16S rRNA (uracil1498-N3)-methyltransferase
MVRLFVPSAQVAGTSIRIRGPELRHLRTLRLGPGDLLRAFDEHGSEHEVRLVRIGAGAAEGAILNTHRPARESALELVLAPALLKGTKMDLVVEKATELGVQRIVPFSCRHAVAQGARHERWRRIAVAAAKQSGRTRVPAVEAPVPFASLVGRPWEGFLRVLAWEGEQTRTLAHLPPAARAVVVVVGPEGGFAADEVNAAHGGGFESVRLAPRVLRAETAALVATALCQHRWGDLSSAPELG